MPIQLKLADLASTPQQHSALLPTGWCAELAGDMFSAKAAVLPVAFTASKAADVVSVSGECAGDFGFACSRCAEQAEVTVKIEFTHHFVGPGQLDAGEPTEAADFDADPDVSEHDGVHIELDDVLIEHFLVELPWVPLCAEGCLGLCPQCAVNLNHETCACASAKPVDTLSPWAQLAELQLPKQRN